MRPGLFWPGLIWPGLIWAGLLGLLLGVAPASAHLMSRGHGTLNVVKDSAYIVIALPVTVFAQGATGPAVADGVLTAKELKTHEKAFRAAIREGVVLTVGGQPVQFRQVLLNLPKGDHHAADQSKEITAMIVAPLGDATQPMALTCHLWGAHAQHLKLRATVSEGRTTLRKEVFELTPAAPTHRLFAASDTSKRPQSR